MTQGVTNEGEARSERLRRRVLQVCNASGTLVEYWGFKSIIGRVWTLLALTRAPLAQTEIADQLGVSRSLVSGAISELTDLGLVEATEEHRNAPYRAVMDVWPIISDVLRSREWMLLESTRLALEAALEETQLEGGGPYDAGRMRVVLQMIEAIQKLLAFVLAVRRSDSVRGLQTWIASVTSLLDTLRRRA